MRLKIAGQLVPEGMREATESVKKTFIEKTKESIKQEIQEELKEHIYDNIVAGFKALGAFLYDFSYVVTLVGGGICILMWVMGWKDGFKYTGIAVGVNVMIRILLSEF